MLGLNITLFMFQMSNLEHMHDVWSCLVEEMSHSMFFLYIISNNILSPCEKLDLRSQTFHSKKNQSK